MVYHNKKRNVFMKNIITKIILLVGIIDSSMIFASQGISKTLASNMVNVMQDANKTTERITKFTIDAQVAAIKARQKYNQNIPLPSTEKSKKLIEKMYQGDTKIEGNLDFRTLSADNTFIQHTLCDGILVKSSHFNTSASKAVLKKVTLYNYLDPADVESLQSAQSFYIDTTLPNENSWSDQSTLHNVTQVATSRTDGKTIIQTIDPSDRTLSWHLDKDGNFGFTPDDTQVQATMITSIDKKIGVLTQQKLTRNIFDKHVAYFDKDSGDLLSESDGLNDAELKEALNMQHKFIFFNQRTQKVIDALHIFDKFASQAESITDSDAAEKMAENIIEAYQSTDDIVKKNVVRKAVLDWQKSKNQFNFREWIENIIEAIDKIADTNDNNVVKQYESFNNKK
jgi:hypothetical protein